MLVVLFRCYDLVLTVDPFPPPFLHPALSLLSFMKGRQKFFLCLPAFCRYFRRQGRAVSAVPLHCPTLRALEFSPVNQLMVLLELRPRQKVQICLQPWHLMLMPLASSLQSLSR